MRKTSKKRTNNKAGLIDRETVGTRLIDIRKTISELPVTPDIATLINQEVIKSTYMSKLRDLATLRRNKERIKTILHNLRILIESDTDNIMIRKLVNINKFVYNLKVAFTSNPLWLDPSIKDIIFTTVNDIRRELFLIDTGRGQEENKTFDRYNFNLVRDLDAAANIEVGSDDDLSALHSNPIMKINNRIGNLAFIMNGEYATLIISSIPTVIQEIESDLLTLAGKYNRKNRSKKQKQKQKQKQKAKSKKQKAKVKAKSKK